MDYTILKEFLQPGLLILVVLLMCMGEFIKTIPKWQNWTIPVTLWGIGVIVTILWFGSVDGRGFTLTVFINGFIQGTFVAALAVFGNNIYKQFLVAKEGVQK